MVHRLAFFLSMALLSVHVSQLPVLFREASLVKLKAVGGRDKYEGTAEDVSESSSSSEEYSNEYSEELRKSQENEFSEYGESVETIKGISYGNPYFDKYLGNSVYSFRSTKDLVKFLLYESKFRKIPANFIDCTNIVQFYFESKFTPNTGEDGEIIASSKELIDALNRYIRTNGDYLRKFAVKRSPQAGKSAYSKYAYDNHGYESDTESSSESDPETSQRTTSQIDSYAPSESSSEAPSEAPSVVPRPKSPRPEAKLESLMEKLTPVRDPLDQIFVKHDTGAPVKAAVSSDEGRRSKPPSQTSRDLDQDVGEIPDLEPAVESGVGPEASAKPVREPRAEHESEERVLAGGVSQEMIIPCLDLKTRSYISFEGKELEFELKTPWRSFISMLLYEPVRRSSLVYDEEHCKNITKATGRIIAYLIHASCKLSQALKDYNKKKCGEKSRFSKLLVGCYQLKRVITKYTHLYSKLRYDLVDTVVGITQCSLAKNGHTSQAGSIHIPDEEELGTVQCTLREYYFSMDFQFFLAYITDAYKSAVEKLRKIVSGTVGTSVCPTRCRNKSQILLCFEDAIHNLLADKTSVEKYNSHLSVRNAMCKVSLIRNYSFSGTLPETTEYISKSGIKYRVPTIPYIKTVQFPVLHPSNMEKFSIIKSSLLSFLLNSAAPQELLSPTQKSPTSEKSPTKDEAPKPKPMPRSKLKHKKDGLDITDKTAASLNPLSGKFDEPSQWM